MTLPEMLAAFRRSDSGAVAIDWVVLTTTCIGLGAAVFSAATDLLQTAPGRTLGTVAAASSEAAAIADERRHAARP